MENYGKIWHIDHVIPISKFDLNNNEEQLVAFNWRNTMPLSSRENLSKNNKIIKEQVLEHVDKILICLKYIFIYLQNTLMRETP